METYLFSDITLTWAPWWKRYIYIYVYMYIVGKIRIQETSYGLSKFPSRVYLFSRNEVADADATRVFTDYVYIHLWIETCMCICGFRCTLYITAQLSEYFLIDTYVHLRTCWKKRVRIANCIMHMTQRVLMNGNKLSSTSCRKSEPNWPV